MAKNKTHTNIAVKREHVKALDHHGRIFERQHKRKFSRVRVLETLLDQAFGGELIESRIVKEQAAIQVAGFADMATTQAKELSAQGEKITGLTWRLEAALSGAMPKMVAESVEGHALIEIDIHPQFFSFYAEAFQAILPDVEKVSIPPIQIGAKQPA